MTLHIQAAGSVEVQELRSMIVDNLHTLLGDGARVEEKIPSFDESCLVAVNARDEMTLISFDATDPSMALVNGLTRMEQLSSELATLLLHEHRRPEHLLVLATEPPPGLALFSGRCPVNWRGFRVLSVNGENGLFLDEPLESHSTGLAAVEPIRREAPSASQHDPELTEEETKHFEQL